MSALDISAFDTALSQEASTATRQRSTKRGNDENAQEATSRKGRSALGDVTNRGRKAAVAGAAAPQGAKGSRTRQPKGSVLTEHGVSTNTTQASGMDVETSSQPEGHGWKDIDKDSNSPTECAAIAQDIMKNLFAAEMAKMPFPDYIQAVQSGMTADMRAILVDWLVEVAQEYKLSTETLHLTVNYVDRYLCRVPTPRNLLQLVGVTCMLLASKYEEIYPPTVEDFCFITENSYKREEVLACERQILLALKFELTAPTIRIFLRRFIKAAKSSVAATNTDHRMDMLSSYLSELTLLEMDALQFPPSMIAASAVLLALFYLGGHSWNETLQHYTTYSAPELESCALFMHRCVIMARTNDLPAIREKYASPVNLCVAELQPPEDLPSGLFRAIGPLREIFSSQV